MSPSSVPDVPFLHVRSPLTLLPNFVLFRMSSSVKNCMKESGSGPTMYSSSMKTAVIQIWRCFCHVAFRFEIQALCGGLPGRSSGPGGGSGRDGSSCAQRGGHVARRPHRKEDLSRRREHRRGDQGQAYRGSLPLRRRPLLPTVFRRHVQELHTFRSHEGTRVRLHRLQGGAYSDEQPRHRRRGQDHGHPLRRQDLFGEGFGQGPHLRPRGH